MQHQRKTQIDLPTLSREAIANAGSVAASTAAHPNFPEYPERVLQFGTGAFLRGFAEYFVDQANRAGKLNGRIVMVGSTGSGRVTGINDQDGLYTLVVRGRENGVVVDRSSVIGAVSRAIASSVDWDDVLAVARNPALCLVISNTTEVGIQFDETDGIDLHPPRSFPGKLTAVLYERARVFDFDPDKGLIVLPCELLEDNGKLLRSIVLKLADQWNLGSRFRSWLDASVVFCNTLVDRIVPGTPDDSELEALFASLEYHDELLTVAEPYRLFAIEGDGNLESRLPLTGVDPGIVIARDIRPYRERKVRILNGTHTIMSPVAILSGLGTVAEAMNDPDVSRFVRHVLNEEIVPSLDIDPDMARSFAADVLDRFANPFVRHEILGITFQQTTKMRVRVVPSLLGYVEKRGALPAGIVAGFACFLWFQHPSTPPAADARPADDARAMWIRRWDDIDTADAAAIRRFVSEVAADEGLWGARLDRLPDFVDRVTTILIDVANLGAGAVLKKYFPAASS